MKLQTKTILAYLLIAIIVFGIGGIVAYRLISEEISKETDYYMAHSLEIIERRLERAVEHGYKLTDRFNTNQVKIKHLPYIPQDTTVYFSDTIAMHPHLNQMETMRKLKANRKIRDEYFSITMIDVVVEASDIYESVIKIISRLFVLFAIALILGTFLLSRTLLKPFKETLNRIKSFNLQENTSLTLPKTTTKEFQQLNEFLGDMTSRAQNDYQLLKKFSENASHEMQTPLAIASGKLELLTDSENLTEDQFLLAAGAQQALKKLSQLGHSLSLLTKIENREFVIDHQTDFSAMVKEAMDNFHELFLMKNIEVVTDVKENVRIDLNQQLGSILLNNLLHNSIKHNTEGGKVNINLDENRLMIKNTGDKPIVPTSQLFERFEKGSTHADSSGLGLSIVKEICDLHDMKIGYSYNGQHVVEVSF